MFQRFKLQSHVEEIKVPIDDVIVIISVGRNVCKCYVIFSGVG